MSIPANLRHRSASGRDAQRLSRSTGGTAAVLVLLLGAGSSCSESATPRGWDQVVGPEGAVLRGYLKDGVEVGLRVPPWPARSPTRFSMQLVDAAAFEFGSNALVGGYVMELGPDGAEFSTPLQLTMVVPPAQQVAGAALYGSRPGLPGQYEPIPPSHLDSGSGTATYDLRHFSVYFMTALGAKVHSVALQSPIVPGPGNTFQVEATLSLVGAHPPVTIAAFRDSTVVTDTILPIGGQTITSQLPTALTVTIPVGPVGSMHTFEIHAPCLAGSCILWRQNFVADLESVEPLVATPLIERFAPILEFAPGEPYRPVSLGDFLNVVALEIRDPVAGVIRDPVAGFEDGPSTREAIALWGSAATPGLYESHPRSVLAVHGNIYSSIHYVDEAAARSPDWVLPTKLYARAVYDPLTPDRIALSYFMFYPFDEKGERDAFSDTWFGHSGDRESFQILLEREAGMWNPKRATFGQHKTGQFMTSYRFDAPLCLGAQCLGPLAVVPQSELLWSGDAVTLAWTDVNTMDEHPILYIARGSHAVYPRRGEFRVVVPVPEVDGIFAFSPEMAGGDTDSLRFPAAFRPTQQRTYDIELAPNVREIQNAQDPKAYFLYSGAWIKGRTAHAPIFPFLDRWYDPFGWDGAGSNAFQHRTGFGPAYHARSTAGFPDVADSDWFACPVENLQRRGVLQGDLAGLFRPGDNMNRAEFVEATVKFRSWLDSWQRSNWHSVVVEDVACFTDVAPAHWFYRSLQVAAANGIIDNDCTLSSSFRPADPINRAEAAKIITLALGFPLVPAASCSFTDVAAADWFASYVCTLQQQGIAQGYNDGSFRPGNPINRAEAAKLLWLAYDIGVCDPRAVQKEVP